MDKAKKLENELPKAGHAPQLPEGPTRILTADGRKLTPGEIIEISNRFAMGELER